MNTVINIILGVLLGNILYDLLKIALLMRLGGKPNRKGHEKDDNDDERRQ